MTLSFTAQGQYSVKEGYKQFEAGNYELAVEIFNKYTKIEKDKKALASRGIANFHINKLNAAIKDLSLSKTLGNNDKELIWYVAKSYHHKGRYLDAIKFYKSFLDVQKKRSKIKGLIQNEIKRCAFALNHKADEPFGSLESFGNDVNSKKHEINPIASVNNPNKYYFSSNVAKDFDLFSVSFEDGVWTRKDDFKKDINTSNHEVIQDLSPNGEVLFIKRGESLESKLVYKQFTNDSKVKELDEAFLEEDVDYYFIDNQTIIFASTRDGGYGGYDLYTRKYLNNKWTAPKNLGPTINSAFDERSPFLTPDGLHLFFSSNGVNTFGGYDVFHAELRNDWLKPKNLGGPINSPGDDLFFKITDYGQLALLSSDRKTAKGGFDIYQVFLKIPIPSIRDREAPLAFIKSPRVQKKIEEKVIAVEAVPEKKKEKTEIVTPTKVETKKEVVVVEKKTELPKSNPVVTVDKTESTSSAEPEKKKVRMASGPIRRKPVKKKIKETQKKEPIVDLSKKPTEQIPASEKIVEKTQQEKKKDLVHPVVEKTTVTEIDLSEEEIIPKVEQDEKHLALSDQEKIIKPIYFESTDHILMEGNEEILDNVIRIMDMYPESSVVLIGHSHNKGLVEFQLYRNLLSTEKVASYLMMSDIELDRISIKSVGSNYPFVKANAEASVKKFNQKIDILFHDIPFEVNYVLPDIRPFEKENKYEIFHTVVDEIYYRVEIIQQEKMYKNSVLRNYNDLMVEKNNNTKQLSYMVGFYPDFDDALDLQAELQNTNVPLSRIVAFYNGKQLDRKAVEILSNDYPELDKYLQSLEE